MNEKPDSGGSAFPQVQTDNRNADYPDQPFLPETYSAGGMTMRDYYAAKAMAALIAAYSGTQAWGPSTTAQRAFEYADAMLRNREC